MRYEVIKADAPVASLQKIKRFRDGFGASNAEWNAGTG
jgi:hypothetical protein